MDGIAAAKAFDMEDQAAAPGDRHSRRAKALATAVAITVTMVAVASLLSGGHHAGAAPTRVQHSGAYFASMLLQQQLQDATPADAAAAPAEETAEAAPAEETAEAAPAEETAEAAPAEEAPAEEASTEAAPAEAAADAGAEAAPSDTDGPVPGGQPDPMGDHAFNVGWNKQAWTASDWMAWVIPGPIVTIIVTSFVFYMYGPVWSVGVCAVLIAVDAFALYVNA